MYLLSLCIPTYNRADSLKESLRSICEQSEFSSTGDIEIIISDNNSSDHTESVCNHFVQLYGERIKYFKNTTNIEDLNFECVLSKGSGTLLKLNNDTLTHRKGSLAGMLETIRSYIDINPIIFFSNGKSNSKQIQECYDLDSFLARISFNCAWIGGFSIWKDNFDLFEDFNRYSSKKLTQADVLLRLVDKKRVAVIDDRILFKTARIVRGDYNFLNVFYNNYFSLLEECLRENRISKRVYSQERLKIVIKHICPWVAKSKQKHKSSFDVSKHWEYLFRYFGNDHKTIALYWFKYLYFNVKYFLSKYFLSK